MEVTTGNLKGLSQWSAEVTVEFIQAPAERREAYWAALAWFAERIQNELTASGTETEAVKWTGSVSSASYL